MSAACESPTIARSSVVDAAVPALEAERPARPRCSPAGRDRTCARGGRLAPSSSMVPCATRLPFAMMTTSSTVCSTSDSMARDERAALCRKVAQEPAQPPDAIGVQAVRGLVEDDDARVSEQGGREPESLPHAHRVAACALARRGRDAHELEHLVHATGRDPRRGGKGQQVVAPGAPRMEVGRLERRPDDGERVGDVVVATPLDGCVPAVGRISPRSIRRVVVLPAPFGPRKPVIRPGTTSRSRWSTAVNRRTAW